MNLTGVDYGYGQAAPDISYKADVAVDYGYGRASPTTSVSMELDGKKPENSKRVPRKSSMKQCGVPRRASIGYSGEIEIQLPGRRDSVTRRTSITIAENKNEVREVEPTPSLTTEPLWFQAEEYDMINQKALLLTQLAQSGNHKILAENDLCTRGLESHIDCDAVFEQQYLAWKSVFLEQYHQRHTHQFCDETVSKIYHLAGNASRERAVHRARQDTVEAEKYTRSTRIMMRRLSM